MSNIAKKHENYDMWDFGKVKVKSYYSKNKLNNSTELLGYSLLKNYNNNPPPDPNSGFVPRFSGNYCFSLSLTKEWQANFIP